MPPLRLLDLFSGIGGFSYAAEYLVGGYTTVQFVEREPFCQRILNQHWPDVPIHPDITTFEPEPGSADVVCGGFPCQDISTAGKGAGIKEGTRSGLFYELIRVVRLVRPRYVVLENVAAILTNGLDTVLGELAEAGFDAEWACIPASAVGACHQRDRWWLVAYSNSGDGQPRPISRSRVRSETGKKRPNGHFGSTNEVGVIAYSSASRFQSSLQAGIIADAAQTGTRVESFIKRGTDTASDSNRCTRSIGRQQLQRCSPPGEPCLIHQDIDGSSSGLQRSSSQADVAYSNRERQQEQQLATITSGTGWTSWGDAPQQLNPDWRSYLSEPVLCRGDDGLSDRVDRLKTLGNAVVPQVAAIPLARVLELAAC